MPTNIQIASNALVLVGDNAITSFDDPGAGAEVATAIYSETYRELLAEHPWTFALKEQLLNQLSQTPDDLTGFDKAYQIPGEVIRLWAIFPQSQYTIVGNLIYSNENELLARYTYKVAETSLPPHFVKVLEYKLASDFAVSVTDSASKAELYEVKHRKMLAMARTIDSQSKPQTPIVDSPFVNSRVNDKGIGTNRF